MDNTSFATAFPLCPLYERVLLRIPPERVKVLSINTILLISQEKQDSHRLMGGKVILTMKGDRADGGVLGKYRSCTISLVNVAVYHRHLPFVRVKHDAVGNMSRETQVRNSDTVY